VSRTKIVALALVLLAIVIASSATYYYLGQKGSPVEQVLTIGMSSGVTTWNIQGVCDTGALTVMRHVYETLITRKVVGGVVTFEPCLAQSWKIYNETCVEFSLRRGVKWHDGRDFTARDVVYSLKRMKSEGKWKEIALGPMNAFVQVDNYTVLIGAPKPYGPIFASLALHHNEVVPEGATTETLENNPIGTGPFKFVEWVQGERLVLVRNDNYWGEKAKADKLIFMPVADDATRVVGLETGTLDIIGMVPPPEATRLANERFVITTDSSARFLGVAMNCQKAPFNDTRVRQALNYAIDKEAIVRTIYSGYTTVADSCMTPAEWGYKSFKNSTFYFSYDPAKARQLLAEAGYPQGFSMKFKTCVGRYPQDREVSTAIAGYLEAIGISVDFSSADWPTFQAELVRQIDMWVNQSKQEYDMFFFAPGASSFDADYALYQVFQSKAYWNLPRYINDEVDQLLEEQRYTLNSTLRLTYVQQAEEIIYREASYIWIASSPIVFASKSNIKGMEMVGWDYPYFFNAYKE
jgi:peptide/nickel transport system substrate-binding protein